MKPIKTRQDKSNGYSLLQTSKRNLPDIVTYSSQYIDELRKELKEARKDAERWGLSFDQCYEDLRELKEQIKVLEKENYQLIDEVQFLRAKLSEFEEINLDHFNEKYTDVNVNHDELDPLLPIRFDQEEVKQRK
jgi:uncharacterized coiled-coil DUF342 family protein